MKAARRPTAKPKRNAQFPLRIAGIGIDPEDVCDQPEGAVTLELVGGAVQDLHPSRFRRSPCLGSRRVFPIPASSSIRASRPSPAAA
jgi:hypothetical protein